MSFLIFLIGTTIFLSYIFFFSYFEKEEKKNTIKIDDAIDYDGHGNWGRFPPKKTTLKEGRVKTNTKPSSKTKKPNIDFMGQEKKINKTLDK